MRLPRNQTNPMHKLYSILIILLCLGACSPGHNDYSHFTNIPNEGWKYGDTLTIIPTPADSVSNGDLIVAIRHSNEYRYSNLWIEVCYTDNKSAKKDTINIEFADIYGKWYGKGLGVSFQITDTIASGIKLVKNQPIFTFLH